MHQVLKNLFSVKPVSGRVFWIGFLYWLVFLLALEPGNALRFVEAGHAFPFVHETLRILGAAAIGMLTTPFLVPLAPPTRSAGMTGRLSRLTFFTAANVALAGGMIVASCVLAAWGFQHRLAPSLADIAEQLVANGPLVGFAVLGLAIVSGVFGSAERSKKSSPQKVFVREARQTRHVDVQAILWIESKGNHIVVHERDGSHLTRCSLRDFSVQLDHSQFFQIHRRMVVAFDAVVSITTVTNGDAEARLVSGRVLKVSRRKRAAFQKQWAEFHGKAY